MRRPWNLTNLPIYSLVTYDNLGNYNMNICTYVSVINMNPKIYTISIDFRSFTYLNLMNKSSKNLLQCLSKDNINTVLTLGKKSGKTFNKSDYLNAKGLIGMWKGIHYLKNTSFLLELKNMKKIKDFPDHALFKFELNSFKCFNDSLLTFNDLVDNRIIL